MDARRKCAAVGAVCAAMTIVALVTGCASQAGPSDEGASWTGSEDPAFADLVALYPNEYESSQVHKTDEEGEDNSHANLPAQLKTPAVRAGGVAIIREVSADDPEKAEIPKACLSCKTSLFNDMYAEEGMAVFDAGNNMTDADFAALDDQYFDCYSCHAWKDGKLNLEPGIIFAQAEVFPQAAEFFDGLNAEEAVCGQCHNYALGRDALGGYTEEQAQDCNPFKYGTDPEGMYRYLLEIEAYSVDEATGIKLLKANHPQVETFQGSIHQSMGLSCVDCHMNTVEDAQGSAYTSHDASSSVAADDEAMARCLTCHETQSGIATVEDMRAFLGERQAAQASRQGEVEQELAGLYDLIAARVQDGTVDEGALQEAKDAYSFAYFLVKEQQQNLNDPVDGAQIAHDPAQMRSMLERASVLVEEGVGLIG